MTGTVDNLTEKAQGMTDKAADAQAQATLSRGFDAVGDIADRARDMATNATDSIVSYTKKNPVKALAIAAVSGAFLYAAMRAYQSYRD